MTDAGEPVVGVAFSSDGGLVVAAGKRGDAVAWSTAGLLGATPVAELPGTVAALRVGDTGARWAVAAGSATIGVYDDRGMIARADRARRRGVRSRHRARRGGRGRSRRSRIAAIPIAAAARCWCSQAGAARRQDLALRDAFPVGATWSDDDGYAVRGRPDRRRRRPAWSPATRAADRSGDARRRAPIARCASSIATRRAAAARRRCRRSRCRAASRSRARRRSRRRRRRSRSPATRCWWAAAPASSTSSTS